VSAYAGCLQNERSGKSDMNVAHDSFSSCERGAVSDIRVARRDCHNPSVRLGSRTAHLPERVLGAHEWNRSSVAEPDMRY